MDDAEALTDLHLDVWEQAYSQLVPPHVLADRRASRSARVDRWRKILSHSAGATWLADDSDADRLIGFVSAGSGRDSEPDLPGLELMALYVRADAYGSGVGHALMDAAIRDDPAYLWVLDGNLRAVRFYERHGFAFDGCTKAEHVGTERRMVRPAPVE